MATKFPGDAPLERVLRALEQLGFVLLRRGNHLSLSREEPDGTHTPLTLPGHRTIKGSTLRTVLTQSGISRENFCALTSRRETRQPGCPAPLHGRPCAMSRSFARSLALFERAARVIPGGIYGHTHPAATLPMASPYYAVRAEGCRYWDADEQRIPRLPLRLRPQRPRRAPPGGRGRRRIPAREGRLLQPPHARRRGPRRTPRLAGGFRRVGGLRQERLGHDHLGAPGRPRTHRAQENPDGRTGPTTAATRGVRPATAG